MGLECGFDNLENGKKIFVKYNKKNYNKFLEKFTKQKNDNENLNIKFYKFINNDENKYSIKLKNFFFYKFNNRFFNDLLRFNFEFSTKNKNFNNINFNVLPLCKFSINKLIIFKYGKYSCNKEQLIFDKNQFENICFNNNKNINFSKIFPSMIKTKRFEIYFNKNFNINNNFNYNLKFAYNNIKKKEENIKIKNYFKIKFNYNFFNFFDILFYNNFSIKKSFIFNKKTNFNHFLSFFPLKSKILEMNIANDYIKNIIKNGNDFFLYNFTNIKFNLLFLNKHLNLTSKIFPFINFETFILPKKKINKMFKIIFSFGIGLKIQENIFINFDLFTKTKNIKIQNKFINRFRLKIGT